MLVAPEIDIWSTRITRALTGEGVTSVFQPIVDLHRMVVVGYEALTRFDEVDGRYMSPDKWFAAAASLDVTAELDVVTLRAALAARRDLPRNCFLSVNVDPESLLDRRVIDLFRAQGNLAGLVIEITEHRRWDWTGVAPAVESLRAAGARFAVDDAGAGYSGLQQILQLRPSILKLDRSIIDGTDQDEAKRALIEMLGIFASRIDAWVLAEGIETPSEAQTLMELEVPLVQGFYFARPGPTWQTIDPLALTELRRIPRGKKDSLHHLVDPVRPVSGSGSMTDLFTVDADWVAVVDIDRRPMGLVGTATSGAGLLTDTLITNVHSSPCEVGHRLATSATAEPCAPVIVVDNSGHYVGLISIRRLLRALSSSDLNG